jgi:hypothetical protein
LFIALIPKILGVVDLKEFRARGGGWIYKIIAKILANRLKIGFGEDHLQVEECIHKR